MTARPDQTWLRQVVGTIMLTDQNNSGYWAQDVWLELPGGARHTFEQLSSSTGITTHYDAAQTINTYTIYTVLYGNAAPGVFSFQYAGVTSSFKSAAYIFSPNEAEWFGETHSNADQMPGGYSSSYHYEDLNNVQLYLTGSGWTIMNTPFNHFIYSFPGGHGSPYGQTQTSGTNNYHIWDTRCPH
jgi:hypothetical protein